MSLQLQRVCQLSLVVLNPLAQTLSAALSRIQLIYIKKMKNTLHTILALMKVMMMKRKQLSKLYKYDDKYEMFLFTNCTPVSPGCLVPQKRLAPKRKQILGVFSCLMQLFQFCPMCQQPAAAEVSKVVRTLIHITQKCHSCSYCRVWRCKPCIKKMPAGNLLLSAAILFSGAMISQTLSIF